MRGSGRERLRKKIPDAPSGVGAGEAIAKEAFGAGALKAAGGVVTVGEVVAVAHAAIALDEALVDVRARGAVPVGVNEPFRAGAGRGISRLLRANGVFIACVALRGGAARLGRRPLDHDAD